MDEVTIRIKLKDAAQFAADAKLDATAIDEVGNAAERANKKARKGADGMNILQKAIKPAGWIALAGLITQGSSLAVGSVIGLVAALVPLVGIVGALPAGVFGLAQGLAVLKLGFMGVGGAVGGLNEQMDPKKFAALQQPAQAFALSLNSLKAPILALQRRIQGGLFPGLTAGLNAARPAISALSGPLAGTARILGQFGDKLGHLVGSKGFLADLHSQAGFNNIQFQRLSGAGLHVVDAFRQLMVASRPLVTFLVHMVDGWAKSADAMATTGRQSGKLQAFFKRTASTIGDVVKIGTNLAATLIRIGGIADKQVGSSLLQSLVKGSAALRAWASSAEGTRKISGYFAAIKSTLREVGPALVQVGGLIGVLGSSSGLGVLGLEAMALGDIAKSIAWIAKVIPGGTPAIVAFATAFYIFQKLKIATAITAVVTAIRYLALNGVMGAAVDGFWALNASMLANPAVIIGLAIVALAGGLYLAYTRSQTFRDGINGVADAIRSNLAGALNFAIDRLNNLIDIINATDGGTLLKFLTGGAVNYTIPHVGHISTGTKPPVAATAQQAMVKNIVKATPDLAGLLAGKKTLGFTPVHPATKPKIVSGRVSGAVLAPGHVLAPTLSTPSLSAPTHAKVTRSTAHTASTGATEHIHVHVKSELKLDGQKVAESTSEAVAKHEALG